MSDDLLGKNPNRVWWWIKNIARRVFVTMRLKDAYIDEKMIEWEWPEFLNKAACDHFDYAIGLSDGSVWRVRFIRPINKDWVHIDGCAFIDGGKPFEFARGVQVRVANIVWIADAPEGS